MSLPSPALAPDTAGRLGESAAEAGSSEILLIGDLAEDQELAFLNEGGILSAMARVVMDSVGASGISVAYASQGSVVCRASCGDNAPAVGTPLNLNSGIGAQCLREGKTVKCADTESDPRVNKAVCRKIGVRSILAVPLLLNSKVLGIAQVYYPEPNGFSEAIIAELEQSAHLFVSSLPVGATAEASPISAMPLAPAESALVAEAATSGEDRWPAPAPAEVIRASVPVRSLLAEDVPPMSVEESQTPARPLSDWASEGSEEDQLASLPAEIPEPAGKNVAQAPLAVKPESPGYTSAPVLASFAQAEEPAWWKRPTVAAAALSIVLALSWVISHSSSRKLVSPRPAATSGAVEKSQEVVNSAISQMPFAQLLNLAQSGNPQAQFALAVRYERGKGVAKNLTKAYSWYIVAAEAGNDSARNAIRPLTSKLTSTQLAGVRLDVAHMYANGIGVRRRDPVAAYTWMILAEAAGDSRAQAEQKTLAASMRPQEITEARSRASNWLKARGYSTP